MSYTIWPQTGQLPEEQRRLLRAEYARMDAARSAKAQAEAAWQAKLDRVLDRALGEFTMDELYRLVTGEDQLKPAAERYRARRSVIEERRRRIAQIPDEIQYTRGLAEASRKEAEKIRTDPDFANWTSFIPMHEGEAARLDQAVAGLEAELAQLLAVEEGS